MSLHLLCLLRSLVVEERHQRRQSGILPIRLAQHRSVVAHVVDYRLCIPKHRSVDVSHLLMQAILSRHLVAVGIAGIGVFHRTFHVLADEKRTIGSIAVPPGDERLIVGSSVSYLPVDLRHAIVNPALVHPKQHISIEVVIVLQAGRLASHLRITLFVAINAEWRHTEFHPRLHFLDGFR